MKILLYIITFLVFISACNKKEEEISFPFNALKIKPIPTLELKVGNNIFDLNPYFRELKIDSIENNNLKLKVKLTDDNILQISYVDGIDEISEIRFWSDGFLHTILVSCDNRHLQKFVLEVPDSTYKTVSVVGDFNDWNTSASMMTYKDTAWTTAMLLPYGSYEYMFCVDSVLIIDKKCRDSVLIEGEKQKSVLKLKSEISRPRLFTWSHSNGTLQVNCTKKIDKAIVLWQNIALDTNFVKVYYDKIKIKIPTDAKALNESQIRVWAISEDTISNDVVIPLINGDLISDSTISTSFSDYSELLYFLIIDKFLDGNKTNNRKINGRNIEDKFNFMGGDFAGITKKLSIGYFNDLNISTLLLSPISQISDIVVELGLNKSTKITGFHGFWKDGIYEIDSRFGKNTNKLIAESVEKNIPIKIAYLPAKYYNRTNQPNHSFNGRFCQFCEGSCAMPNPIADNNWKTGLENKFYADEAKFKKWISTLGFAGVFDLFGDEINFRQYKIGIETFATDQKNFIEFADYCAELFSPSGAYRTDITPTSYWNMQRFISVAGNSLDEKEKANTVWYERNVMVRKPAGYDKFMCYLVFLMTNPGRQLMLYGDEIGMPGAGFPDNFRAMHFENLTSFENKMKKRILKLTTLRCTNPAVLFGDLEFLHIAKKQLVYCRTFFDNIIVVAFNKKTRKKKFKIVVPKQFKHTELISNFKTKLYRNIDTLEFTLNAFSFEIFTKKLSDKKEN